MIAPTIVVAVVEVEDDRNECPDVLDSHRLGMQCFVHEEGLAKIAGVGDVRGGSIFVEGRVAVIGRAKCGALLGSAGEGIPGARISRLALQEGGLCLRVGGRAR